MSFWVPRASTAPWGLAGVVVVAYLVIGTRWVSHLGWPPLYFTDVLLAAAFMRFAWSRWPLRPFATAADRLLLALVAWSVLRLTFGTVYELTTLRDFAPFLYVLVGVLSALAWGHATAATRHRTALLLAWALALHAAWSVPSLILDLSFDLPANLFSTRPDVDTALNGLLGLLLLLKAFERRDRLSVIFVLAAFPCFLAVLTSDTRAGLLSTSLMGLLTLAMALKSGTRRQVRILAVAAPTAAVLGLIVLPFTPVGERLFGTLGSGSTPTATSAAGTVGARQNSWGTLTTWLTEDTERNLVGVGFGPDFMTDSGALVRLVGPAEEAQEDVRSPHNFLLSTWARLGLIGLVITVALMARALWTGWRLRVSRDPLVRFAILIAFGFLPISMLGVVLESPFGAVPYWWSVGILLAAAKHPMPCPGPAAEPHRTSSVRFLPGNTPGRHRADPPRPTRSLFRPR